MVSPAAHAATFWIALVFQGDAQPVREHDRHFASWTECHEIAARALDGSEYLVCVPRAE